MPKPTAAPELPAHQTITGYNCAPQRKRLARLAKLLTELGELDQQEPVWQAEATQIEAQLNPLAPDAKEVELLQMLRLKLSMVAPRRAELHRLIAACEEEIAAEYDSSLRPAVERVCHGEAARIRDLVAAEIRPFCSSDAAAKARVYDAPRWQRVSKLVHWHHSAFIPRVELSRRALERLDLFDTHKDFEKAAAATGESEVAE